MEEKIKLRMPSKAGFIELEGNRETIEAIIRSINGETKSKKNPKHTIKNHIISMIDSGFLDTPRTLTEIVNKLALKGFKYPSTSIFPIIYNSFLREGIIKRKGKKRSYQYFVETD